MAAAQRPRSTVDPDDKGPPSPTKQPLKRVQIPLIKFNDVAIPHHVDLLKKHKSNIEKFQIQGAWDQVHREQVNATRLVKQLKALLYEMDMLRNQVQDSDTVKFDQLTAAARQSAQDAITEYLNMTPTLTTSRGSKRSNISQSFSMVDYEMDDADTIEDDNKQLRKENIQAQIEMATEELEKQQQCLKSWDHLQTEVRDINELFIDFAKIVHEQQESVDYVETTIENTAENVQEGASHLKYVKTALYPVAGAVIGGCLGGPVGLIAGMKLGSITAIGCGLLGYTGGKILKKKKEEESKEYGVELLNIQKNRSVKGSASLPEITKFEEMPSETLTQKSPADML